MNATSSLHRTPSHSSRGSSARGQGRSGALPSSIAIKSASTYWAMAELRERRQDTLTTVNSHVGHERPKDSLDHPSGKIWSIFLSEAGKHDKALTRGWKDEMDSILIFVSAGVRSSFPILTRMCSHRRVC